MAVYKDIGKHLGSLVAHLRMTVYKDVEKHVGPWVAHLRMTVYKKYIGKHSSTQSPAIHFDRSAVSLRFYMGYVDKTNLV